MLQSRAVKWISARQSSSGRAPRALRSCGAENLLGLPGDPYRGESILIHEFAHVVHQFGLGKVEADFASRLRTVYERAQARGLWRGTYADTHVAEYWAEGVQSWFDSSQGRSAVHNGIRTREQLAAHDPELAALIEGVFPAKEWRWRPPAPAAGSTGRRAPRVFRWDPELSAWYNTYEALRRRHAAVLRGEMP